MPTPFTPENFWERVSGIVGDPDACPVWLGYRRAVARHQLGYGLVGRGGRLFAAHRVAWELTRGPIPEGMCVLHYCDNPPCCAHLFLGTRPDNVADMIAKRRARKAGGDRHWSRRHPELRPRGARHGKHTHPERTPRGESHVRAKLTAADIVTIRGLLSEGVPQVRIAERFGIGETHVNRIKTRAAWRHIP
jgi:hypothetical protein